MEGSVGRGTGRAVQGKMHEMASSEWSIKGQKSGEEGETEAEWEGGHGKEKMTEVFWGRGKG